MRNSPSTNLEIPSYASNSYFNIVLKSNEFYLQFYVFIIELVDLITILDLINFIC